MGLVAAAVYGSKNVPNEVRRPLAGTAPRLSPYEGYICRGFKGATPFSLHGQFWQNGSIMNARERMAWGRPYGIGFYRVGR